MLSIRRENDTSLQIPMDEYVFNAIISKGRLVTNADKTSYVEGLHISNNQTNFIFKFNILQSSIIQEKYPSFLTVGVLGRWKLLCNGYLVFLSEGPSDTYQDFLNDPSSANFVRQTYCF